MRNCLRIDYAEIPYNYAVITQRLRSHYAVITQTLHEDYADITHSLRRDHSIVTQIHNAAFRNSLRNSLRNSITQYNYAIPLRRNSKNYTIA